MSGDFHSPGISPLPPRDGHRPEARGAEKANLFIMLLAEGMLFAESARSGASRAQATCNTRSQKRLSLQAARDIRKFMARLSGQRCYMRLLVCQSPSVATRLGV